VEAQALHRDQLGSVRAVTTFKPLASGAVVSSLRREAAIYKPFGDQTEVLQPTQTNQEQKGWIGERYDADAGLQYLNARYYDPELGIFLQPDWFAVTAAGVGTNRYSYSFNDPVNKMDPGGNCVGNNCRDAYQSKSDGTSYERPHSGYADHGDDDYSKSFGGDLSTGDWARYNETNREETS
jgi:RHS repeat-associated protein